MSIAIIASTHGSSAEKLIETAEMILGEQKNTSWVNFLTDENTETLLKKYDEKLEKLDLSKGVLFLVDIWGGTPFNAASRIACSQKDHEVITGINIPMLIELFMAREDNLPIEKYVEIAINSGKKGIKTLKEKKIISSNILKIKNNQDKNSSLYKEKKQMEICLARIDDRLIHGQVVTRWIKEIPIDRIIVVNDNISKDEIRKTLLAQATPSHIYSHVISIEKTIRVYNNPKYAKDRVMLLFTNPTDVLYLVEKGVELQKVNVGGMAFQHGKIQVDSAISIDEKDIQSFRKLDQYGIVLEVRKIPNDSPKNMMDLIKKFYRKKR